MVSFNIFSANCIYLGGRWERRSPRSPEQPDGAARCHRLCAHQLWRHTCKGSASRAQGQPAANGPRADQRTREWSGNENEENPKGTEGARQRVRVSKNAYSAGHGVHRDRLRDARQQQRVHTRVHPIMQVWKRWRGRRRSLVNTHNNSINTFWLHDGKVTLFPAQA